MSSFVSGGSPSEQRHPDYILGGHRQREAVAHAVAPSPRTFTLATPAMVFAQPNASSMSFRFLWLVA